MILFDQERKLTNVFLAQPQLMFQNPRLDGIIILTSQAYV